MDEIIAERVRRDGSLRRAVLAVAVVCTTALSLLAIRSNLYALVRLRGTMALPQLGVAPILWVCGMLCVPFTGPLTRRIADRSLGAGLLLGLLLLVVVPQRAMYAYSCRETRWMEHCCAARVLGASASEASSDFPCDKMVSQSCRRWMYMQPGGCRGGVRQ